MKTVIEKMLLLILIISFVFIISHSIVYAQTSKARIIPITSEDFLKPLWHPEEAIINAGDIGRYKFMGSKTELKLPDNVKIRPELIKLLNDLQKEFNTSMIIMSGYRSQEDDIYLWAKWLFDNAKCIEKINNTKPSSWSEWIMESQKYTTIFPIATKHQTGDAVDFYWKGLDFRSEKKRDILVSLINELAGTRKYTDEDRKIYGIAEDDDCILKIVPYMKGQGTSVLNPEGLCYFHVEYQPVEFPPKPSIDVIGKRMSEEEELALFYKNGEYILIHHDDFLYPAKVVADSSVNSLDVNVYIFCDEIRNLLGDRIFKNMIHTRREEPKEGWGKNKVMVEYLKDREWNPAMDATEYEDYYLVPVENQENLTISIKDIRFPVAKIH